MASSRTESLGARLLESLRSHPGTGTAWVAFSGGPDSTAVLVALRAVRERLARPLAAVHVDHQWHPQSAQWATHCEMVCDALGVKFLCLRVRAENVEALGPEAALREARYAAFTSLLAPGDLLVTGHHREDQAGTQLLNALRASGTRGLAGMPASRRLGKGWLVRPALDEDRSTLLACARESGLGSIDDPANANPALDRNFIHDEVLPLLATRWPGAVRSLAQSAARARCDVVLLDEMGEALLQHRCDTPGVLVIDPAWLQDMARLQLAIRHWLRRQTDASPPGRRLDEFCRQLLSGRADGALRMDWADLHLRHWQGRLWLHEGALSPCPVMQWDGLGTLSLGGVPGRLELLGGAGLPWTVKVGPRRGGERLPGRGGHHRRVKELLRLAGVPPWMRDSVPLLFHEREPVALGDWALAPELDEHLREQGSVLRWTPGHPVLAALLQAGRDSAGGG